MATQVTQGKGAPASGTAGAGGGAQPVTPRRTRRSWFGDLYRSAVGKKYVMAISGIILMGYVFAHMIGNLKLYLGEDSLNHYSEWLRTFGEPVLPRTGFLWIMRVVLVLAVGFHIHAAWALTQMNRRARRTRYASKRDFIAADFAARTMRWTGIIVALFVIFHVMDLTLGATGAEFEHGQVYDNMIASMSRPLVAAFYVLANLALGFHLYHGAWSLFQSMGWNNRRFNAWRRYFAIAFAVIVVGGNVTFPLAIQLGIV